MFLWAFAGTKSQQISTPPHGTLQKPTRMPAAKPIKHFHKDYHCILLIGAALFDAANVLIFDGMTHLRWRVRFVVSAGTTLAFEAGLIGTYHNQQRDECA